LNNLNIVFNKAHESVCTVETEFVINKL